MYGRLKDEDAILVDAHAATVLLWQSQLHDAFLWVATRRRGCWQVLHRGRLP